MKTSAAAKNGNTNNLDALQVNPAWAKLPLFDRSQWQRVRFGDVVRVMKEQIDPRSGEVERYVAGEHMASENVHIRQWGTIGDGYLGPAFIRRFRKGQVLYGSRRTYLKKVALAEWDGVTSNTTLVLEADEKRLLQRLLPWLMLSERFTKHSVQESKGSTNPYINWPDIAKFEFALPPLAQQRRIAEILWALDEVMQRHKNVTQCMEQLPLSFANHVTGVENGKLDSLRTAPLGDVADVIDCKHRTPKPSSDGVPIVSPGNIKWGPLDVSACKFTSEAEYQDLMDHCEVHEWDMVMGRNQTFGIASFVQPGQRFVLGQDTVLIQAQKLGAKYIYLALQSSSLRSQIDQLSIGSTFKRINLRDIRALRIPLANERQQKMAEDYADNHQVAKDALASQADKLASASSAILNTLARSTL